MCWERQKTDFLPCLHGRKEGCAWYVVARRVAPGTWGKGGLRLRGGGKEFAPGACCSVIKRDFAI